MHGFIYVIDIVSYNWITIILTTNKLIKPSYMDWKKKILGMVLTSDELKWVT